MAWFKVDDGFYSSPKVLSIPRPERLGALGLWVAAGSWSAKHLTDGRVPFYMIDEFGAEMSQGDTLVASGLWRRDADSFVFHDWSDYQPTRTDVLASREKERRRKEEYRAKKARTAGESPSGTTADSSAGQDRVSGHPDPTRPDPTRPNKRLSSEVADATTRPDVEYLLDVLDEEIVRNGGKKPNRTKKNRDAARLLLDRDGKTVEQVERAIRWAQGNEFWRANILSMSKLREKYDQLQLQAKRKPGPVAPQTSGRREEIIDGILWVNGAPTIGGPRGMTSEQYEAWLVETGRG